MEMTIFAKKRTTKDGRPFHTYITRLIRRSDGSTLTAAVKFRMDCGEPDPNNCPMNISVDKSHMNLVETTIVEEDGTPRVNTDGEVMVSRTIWVSDWVEGAPYEDHSMDDFE